MFAFQFSGRTFSSSNQARHIKMTSTDIENQQQQKFPKAPLLWSSCRLTLVLMTFWAVFLLFLMRFNLSMGLVSMTKNGTDIKDYFGNIQVWDKTLQGYILGAFYYGYICTQVCGGYLSDRFGAKVGILVGIGIASVGCLLIPPFARQVKMNNSFFTTILVFIL